MTNFMDQIKTGVEALSLKEGANVASYAMLLIHIRMFITGMKEGMMTNKEAPDLLAKAMAKWTLAHLRNVEGMSGEAALAFSRKLMQQVDEIVDASFDDISVEADDNSQH